MQDVRLIAERLAPEPVITITELDKGGNSRIYKVSTPSSHYALKHYPSPTSRDPRDRLRTETLALREMKRYGIGNIPSVIAADTEHSYSLLSWAEGEAVTEVTPDDIAAFAHFLAQLADMSGNVSRDAMPYASEACVSVATIASHITQRLVKLEQAAEAHDGLKHFLTHIFAQYHKAALDKARLFCERQGWAFERETPTPLQVLIPSDFGSHNALRAQNGELIFLDFEYFGWDDPVTSTANFILHPAMSLPQTQREDFKARMEQAFKDTDLLYTARLDALLPLYAARWCAIILGEFIPERFAHRVASGQYRLQDKEKVLAAQLAKAENMLCTIRI